MSLFAELQRRNVVRVAIAYAVVAWLLAQVADIAFDNFGAPDWVPKSVLFVLILGFPLAVFFAWAFELTPEGVKREKDVDRSQSITNVTGRKLNRLIIAVLVLAVGFLLVDKFVLQPVPEEVIADAPVADVDKSVAVLPFVAMSSGPDDEFFADGLTEEILNSLAQLPDLLVTARTSAFAFKGIDVSIPEIAAQLGVANVVEGSVRRSGDRLRVTAQLIRAEDGFHLWSETYERSTADRGVYCVSKGHEAAFRGACDGPGRDVQGTVAGERGIYENDRAGTRCIARPFRALGLLCAFRYRSCSRRACIRGRNPGCARNRQGGFAQGDGNRDE
jgi:TolB-like protein